MPTLEITINVNKDFFKCQYDMQKKVNYVIKTHDVRTYESHPLYHAPVRLKKTLYVNKALENLLYSHKEPFWHGGMLVRWGILENTR